MCVWVGRGGAASGRWSGEQWGETHAPGTALPRLLCCLPPRSGHGPTGSKGAPRASSCWQVLAGPPVLPTEAPSHPSQPPSMPPTATATATHTPAPPPSPPPTVLDGPNKFLAGHPRLLRRHHKHSQNGQHGAIHRHADAHAVEGDAWSGGGCVWVCGCVWCVWGGWGAAVHGPADARAAEGGACSGGGRVGRPPGLPEAWVQEDNRQGHPLLCPSRKPKQADQPPLLHCSSPSHAPPTIKQDLHVLHRVHL